MQKKIAKRLLVFLLLIVGIFGARLLFAQDFGTTVVNNGLSGSLAVSDPRTIIGRIINLALGFLGVIAVGIIIWGGFVWMTSNGDEEKVTQAKKILKNGVIGLIIILASWAIATFILTKLGGTGSGTGGSGCTDGQLQSCGCGGSMVCSNGSWSGCVGANLQNCVNPPTSCNSGPGPVCQPANQICATGYFCDQTCSCQPQGQSGTSCDSDLSNQKCDADNSRCSEYLTCNPATCLCSGPPVITSVSQAGGFCNANIDKPCASNSDCAGNDTCNSSAPNGAAGNLMTISGKNFGQYSDASRLIFLGSNSPKDFVSPATLNPSCANFWSDTQIVVTVPAGVQTGAIKLTNKDGLSDATNDNYGPQISDFVANKINRPGLCSLNPNVGSLSSQVNYQGINLYSGSAYFGNYQSNVQGLDSSFTNPDGLTGTSTTPNIKAGASGTFVERIISNFPQKSNYLKFTKSPEANAGPYIMSFSPTTGGTGQYATIKGNGFGGARGFNHVYFASGNTKTEAVYQFPSICANSVWGDNQIIVKVPDSLSDGSYIIQVSLGTTTITTQNLNPNTFEFDHTSLPKSGVCKINPDQGPVGTPVILWGEYFGGAGNNGVVRFNYNQDANGPIAKDKDADTINTSVPKAAITGPVKVVKNNIWGNEVNFAVSECTTNAECNNQICCPQNTYKKGRCVSDVKECFIDIPTSVFEWNFSTIMATTSTTTYSSCLGLSKYLGSCYQGAMCPNSPGACSSPSTTYQKPVGTCDITCKDAPGCDALSCTYDPSLDKCVKNVANGVCSLSENMTINRNGDRDIPRIMYWSGKINQHWNLDTGAWESDKDNKSGAAIDTLVYCKKFYPTTEKVVDYKVETINTWRTGLDEKLYTNSKMSVRCILAGEDITKNTYQTQKQCNASGKWEIISYASCPSGWSKQANNRCTQDNATCSVCSDKLTCEAVNSVGRCVSTKTCKDKDARCVDNADASKPDDCVVDVAPSCECCCRIGKAKEDCCAGLDCSGTCGSDLTNKSNTYGSCSGCAAVGSTTLEHDNACNCSGHNSQFCDISPDHPQGICSDCDKISSQESCGDHSSTCCYDSNKTATTTDDFCRGVNGGTVVSKIKGTSDYGYCAYFNCFNDVKPPIGDPKLCASSTPLKIGYFNKIDTCVNGCSQGIGNDVCRTYDKNQVSCANETGCCYDATTLKCLSGNKIFGGVNNGYCAYYNCQTPPGNPLLCNGTPTTTPSFVSTSTCALSCGNPPGGAGLDCNNNKATSTCNFGICNYPGFACLKDTGAGGALPDCGTCCCQVGNNPDSCASPTTPNLHCQAGKGSCTGSGRGLCCGCTQDTDCGSIATVGCGQDACCEARPGVTSTSPAPAATGVCRNTVIKVDFNQNMDVTSLANNFFLFEERAYGNGVCPAGTFLTDARDVQELIQPKSKNIFARLWNSLNSNFKRFFGRVNEQVLATPPDPNKLYCAISGSVGSEQNGTKTSLLFTPSRVLSSAANYYVVVKGDESLNSQTGVFSSARIGMNERGLDEGNGTYIGGSQIKINNNSYLNSYIFKFTTLSDQGLNAGICAIDHVTLNPGSYLFNTTTNDLNEKDTDINNPTFDTVRDSDKLFAAGAYSIDNQLIHPVTGYAWNWNWSIDNSGVAQIENITPGLSAEKKLVAATPGVTDSHTKINATVNMDSYRPAAGCGNNCNALFVGDGDTKASDIYVFLCANPWPPVKSDGQWTPWSDQSGNCLTDPSTCDNYNYKFYYCRDAGSAGTQDDLPAIISAPVVRGQGATLLCSSDRTPCSTSGTACGQDTNGDGSPDGVCFWNVLKESYFFRETSLLGGQITSAIDTGYGGQVQLDWQSPASGVSSYKLYYLQAGKGTMYSQEITAASACKLSGLDFNCTTKIGNLNDGQPYVFKFTVLSTNKNESPLSAEITATPTKKVTMLAPTGLGVEIVNGNLLATWSDPSGTAAYYRVYHGVYSLSYGESSNTAGKVTQKEFTLDQYGVGNHYLAVTAVDSKGNESPKSLEVNFAKTKCANNKPNCWDFVFFKNVLTNVDFEQATASGLPQDWSIANQQHSSVKISSDDHLSGSKSVLLHQDSGDDYPGQCSKKVCDVGICTWNEAQKTCSFGTTDDCHRNGPATYKEGETLCWGNSNRIMWLKLAYSLANLDFKQGDQYAINFYYKGKAATAVGVSMSPNLGWSTFCVGYDYYDAMRSGYVWQNNKVVPTPPPGLDPCNPSYGKTCPEQANACCVYAPVQTKCYSAVNMPTIAQGSYTTWNWYYYPFGYDANMASWLDSARQKIIEIGLSMGYNPTLSGGTDLFVDDFTVKKIATTTEVYY